MGFHLAISTFFRTFALLNKKKYIMIVSSIKWETDGYEVNLPTEVEVEDEMSDDEIADFLSDTYGWLVISFSLPMDDDDVDEFGQYVNEVEGRVS